MPGTGDRLRCIRPVLSVVEPAVGIETATLPNHWRHGIAVVGVSFGRPPVVVVVVVGRPLGGLLQLRR